MFTVETATPRRRQLIARNSDFQLRFNDLLGNVTANLDHALVIGFTSFSHSKHVLTRRQRRQNHSTRAADASITLVVDVDLSSGGRHDHQPRISAFVCV